MTESSSVFLRVRRVPKGRVVPEDTKDLLAPEGQEGFQEALDPGVSLDPEGNQVPLDLQDLMAGMVEMAKTVNQDRKVRLDLRDLQAIRGPWVPLALLDRKDHRVIPARTVSQVMAGFPGNWRSLHHLSSDVRETSLSLLEGTPSTTTLTPAGSPTPISRGKTARMVEN